MLRNKTQLILLAGVLLLFFVGCAQEDTQNDIKDGALLALIEGGVDTKVSFDSIDGKFAWTTGDEIAVWYTDGSTGSYSTFTVNPEDGSVVASSTAGNYRDFYAIYPATNAVDDNSALKVTLPDSYDISDIISGDATAKTGDFSPVPLVAQNTENSSILDFYHVGGLLRINCENVPAGTKSINVTLDKGIAGTFTVDVSQTRPVINATDPAGENSKEVSFILTSDDAGLSQNEDLITLNLPVPCGKYGSVGVVLSDAEGNELASRSFDALELNFTRRHGKKLSISDVAFDFVFGTLTEVNTNYIGGVSSLSSTFLSYKTDETTTEPVPFKLEFSEDGGETWTTEVPDWITLDAIDYGGSVSEVNLGLTIDHQINTEPDVHADNMRNNGMAMDFDLSTINVATGQSVNRTTANCYVVQKPGTYQFPTVYGNGVKDNIANTPAYDQGNQDNTNLVLYHFLDHLNRGITSPYIVDQLVSHGASLADFSATLVWTDSPGLITNVEYIAGDEADLTDDHIIFEVPSETICQGNAVVALLNGTDIVWSWHIWITDENMTALKDGANGVKFAPVNLGWYDRNYVNYEGRSCRVRAVQDISGKSSEVNIVQEADNHRELSPGGLLYEFGRKDPFRTRKQMIVSNPEYSPRYSVNGGTISAGIRNPTTHYSSRNSEGTYTYVWAQDERFNTWNAALQNGNITLPVTKTIYDPSPVGFKLGNTLSVGVTAFTEGNSSSSPLPTFKWMASTSTSPAGRWYDIDDDGVLDDNEAFFPTTGYIHASNGTAGYSFDTEGWYYFANKSTNNMFTCIKFSSSSCLATRVQHTSQSCAVRPVAED